MRRARARAHGHALDGTHRMTSSCSTHAPSSPQHSWQNLVGILRLLGLTSKPLPRQMQVGAATPSLQGVPRRVGAPLESVNGDSTKEQVGLLISFGRRCRRVPRDPFVPCTPCESRRVARECYLNILIHMFDLSEVACDSARGHGHAHTEDCTHALSTVVRSRQTHVAEST